MRKNQPYIGFDKADLQTFEFLTGDYEDVRALISVKTDKRFIEADHVIQKSAVGYAIEKLESQIKIKIDKRLKKNKEWFKKIEPKFKILTKLQILLEHSTTISIVFRNNQEAQTFGIRIGIVIDGMKKKMVEGLFQELIQEAINQYREQFNNSQKTDYGKIK